MKRVLLLLCITIALMSCKNEKNKYLNQIEVKIQENAMGNDIGYKPGNLDTVIIMTNKMLVTDFEDAFKDNIDTIIDFFTNTYKKAEAEKDESKYLTWKYLVGKMNDAKKGNPDSISFSVFKYEYTIQNFLDKSRRVNVENYYFFEYNDSLVGMMNRDEMQNLLSGEHRTPNEPYILGMSTLCSGLLEK